MRPRIFLYVSILLIVAYWVISAAKLLPGSGSGNTNWPDSVQGLSLYAGIRAVVVLALAWSLLRGSGERLADLGFGPQAVKRALLRGTLLAVAIFLLVHVIGNGLRSILGGSTGTAPEVVALFRDPRGAPYWIFAAVIGGGFTEELQRAFVLTRFGHVFGKIGLTVALLVDCISFGIGHLYQGHAVAVQTGLTGLLFALVFLRRRRVADAMVAHGGFDLIGVAAAYALYARGA